jgi:hypothetical protein
VKHLLIALPVILGVPGFVAACPDQHIDPTTPPNSTTALQNAVNLAAGGCSVFLDRGPNGQDTYVLTQTIVLPSNVTITKWPDAPGTITIQAGTNNDPASTTPATFCDLTPDTRNVFCSNGKSGIIIADLNFVPLSGVTVVKNPPDTNAGREVWAVKNGGSDLLFHDNTISNFTDGFFVELDGAVGSNVFFHNNGVNLADRFPLCGTMPCGGNAAFTVVNCGSSGCTPGPASLTGIEFNGNTVVGPDSNIVRQFAVVGGLVFDDNSIVTKVEMKNNRVTQLDHGLFIAATGNCGTADCDNKVSGNRGDNNGNGLTVSRGPNPAGPTAPSCSPGPSPTDLQASGMSITKNTFNSNSFDGGCIAAYTGVAGNPSTSLIMKSNIFNGNKNQCLENYSGVGPTGSSPGPNICRGPGNNGPPPAPPGKGVHPGRGTT